MVNAYWERAVPMVVEEGGLIDAIEGAIATRPVGPLSFRGKSGDVEAFELI